MRNFFLDTNVVLDVLAKHQPFAAVAVQLFERALQGRVTLYVASLAFSNIPYIVRKVHPSPSVITELLTELAQQVQIVGFDAVTIRQALAAGSSGFEDVVQYFARRLPSRQSKPSSSATQKVFGLARCQFLRRSKL